ncbi:hypothetical protein [Bradyrhizobium sp. DASA03120]|uniref:hypothetical protein n=1 Tax=Bradyrhizobium sp. SMVTL-02 TaxID=3395917 RepID=UPI003F6EF4D0
MIDLRAIIATIEKLLAEDTPQSITYAALECRLGIEKVCYDRLKIAHDYIAHEDLRGWRPRDVVVTLITEVDKRATSQQTLYMAKQPFDAYQVSLENIPDKEWVKIGTQAGFDAKLLSEYWQALSNLALHVALPKTKDEDIPAYGDFNKTKAKVIEVLAELKRLVEVGGMLTSGIGLTEHLKCECGRTIQRRSAMLKHEQVINCIGGDCDESFSVLIENGEVCFVRRVLRLDCHDCGEEVAVPTRRAEMLKPGKPLTEKCLNCGTENEIGWVLMRRQRTARRRQFSQLRRARRAARIDREWYRRISERRARRAGGSTTK